MTNEPVNDYDLINLISERHNTLRNMVESLTSDQIVNVSFNSSEWYLINKINQNQRSFSELTKEIHLTRQAIHKAIKQLEQKEVVTVAALPNNKKEKCVTLTTFGIECYYTYQRTKEKMIQYLEETIGKSQVAQLTQILDQDWHLENFKLD